MCDLKHTAVRTHIQKLGAEKTAQVLHDAYQKLECEVGEMFRQEEVTEGVEYARFANLRYVGQEHTLSIEVASQRIEEDVLADVAQSFRSLHSQQYGFELESGLEVVDLVVTGTYKVRKPKLTRKGPAGGEVSSRSEEGIRKVFWPSRGLSEIRVYGRDRLTLGIQLEGPAIVEESTTTVLVPECYTATVDQIGNLILKRSL